MTKIIPIQPKQRIIFRADGNSRIGLGHVTRSLALAHMLRDEYECVFAIQAPDNAVKEQILTTCHGIIMLPSCPATEEWFSHELEAYISEEEIVVLDGYNFGTEYQQNIKARGAVLVCIDDIHNYRFVADAVINQAGGVDESLYSTTPYTKLFLGPDYALLRPPFLKAAGKRAASKPDKLHILLCLGGADPENHTLRIANEVQHLAQDTILEIVVGSAYRQHESLNAWLKQFPEHRFHANLDAGAMYKVMRNCQAAITSASGVAYEYAAVGGGLYITQTADNQAALYEYLITNGLAREYTFLQSGINEEGFSKTISTLKANQRKVFDGKSDKRLLEIFPTLSLQTKLKVREVVSEDIMLLFDWANDPEVRSRSFNTAAIPMEIHAGWFQSKVESPDSLLYIAEVQGKPAAHIRFEIADHTATISYLIGKEFRGNGLSHAVLLKGLKKLIKDRKDINTVTGLVQQDNIASVRAFEKAGFSLATPDTRHAGAHKFLLQVQ